jgi:excisionase family DNA binding protein
VSAALTYSAAEAARALGVSEATVRRLARRGEIPHQRLGTRLVFPKAALHSWLNQAARTG